MPFDGVHWGQGALIPQITYQPNAGAQADLWFMAMVTAYAKSRTYARLVATHAFPWNGILYTYAAQQTTRIFYPGYSITGEYDVYIDSTWTDITALVFYVVASDDAAWAYHHLGINDGATTGNSFYRTEIETEYKPLQTQAIWEPDERNNTKTPIGMTTLTQSLTGYPRNTDFLVWVDACALDESVDPATPPFPANSEVPYRPVFTAIFLESRG